MLPLGVLRVHVRPVVEQELEHGRLGADLARGEEERALPCRVDGVRVRTLLEQLARVINSVRGDRRTQLRVQLRARTRPLVVAAATAGHEEREHDDHAGESSQAALPRRTQPLWPPSPIAFESATSSSTSRASFGT